MKVLIWCFLLMVTASSWAATYHEGDQALYKYSRIRSQESDFRYQRHKALMVVDGGKIALIEKTETIGENGPVVDESQTWMDLRPFENFNCHRRTSVTVAAGTFNVCADLVDSQGVGIYFSSSSQWPFIRSGVKICDGPDSRDCRIDQLELVQISSP